MQYRTAFADEQRMFERELKVVQARLNPALGTLRTMSFQDPANQDWAEVNKKFLALAAQLAHASDETGDFTDGKQTFSTNVFAPASHQFQHDTLATLGIRPSRDIEAHALRQLQMFVQGELDAGRLDGGVGGDEEAEEEAAAALAYRRHQQQMVQQARASGESGVGAGGGTDGGATGALAAAATAAAAEVAPLPWTGAQRRAIAALDINALADRVNSVNAAVWRLQDVAKQMLPSGDAANSLASSLAASEHARAAATTLAARASSASAVAVGAGAARGTRGTPVVATSTVESVELAAKKRASLSAMFSGIGCRAEFRS